MQELSLNILDIAQNSIKANAKTVEIIIEKFPHNKTLIIKINDDGCGMSKETVAHVIDPFYTTRTTRKVGLGVPFFKMSAEMTGGNFEITSELNVGTKIVAQYNYSHIDMMPVGDMASTMMSLISVNLNTEFIYTYKIIDEKGVSCEEFTMDTNEIKIILEGIPINSNEVLMFIKDFINENYQSILEKYPN